MDSPLKSLSEIQPQACRERHAPLFRPSELQRIARKNAYETNRKRVENGTHPFLGGEFCQQDCNASA